MNVIIIGTAYPLRGGIAHYVALLAKYLLKAKHNVEIISFKRQYPKILFPGKTQVENATDGEELFSVKAEMLIDSINPFNWISVGNEIRKRKPDLILFKYWLPFFGPSYGTIAAIAKRNKHTRVMMICDNILPHEKRPGDTLFTKYAFHFADSAIVQSDSVEKDLRTLFPKMPYRKIPHPVYEIFGTTVEPNVARKKIGIGENENIILFFGYVRAYKGLDVLLYAMQKIENVKTLIVGEFYDDEQQYRSLAKELGVENKVRFVSDYIANDEVKFYFSASDAIVLPYKSATQSGIAQIAFNFDKPVITTNVGGLAEIVPDGKAGFVVEPNNPEQLAVAIQKFFSENKKEEFAAQVKIEKQKYLWENLVNAIEELASVGKTVVCDKRI
ncbi:MAG: glycosyltransferase [Ignavibacteria bacterium]|nr:glycosyltransferase [Ignavibacteria bacterium]